MFNYPSCYENASTEFPSQKQKDLESNIKNNKNKQQAHEILNSRNQNDQTGEVVLTFTKRQRKPPESLALSHNTRPQKYLQDNKRQQNAQTHQRQIIGRKEQEKGKKKMMSSAGTQTKFIPLSELKAIAQQYELMLEHNLNSNSASAASEDEAREEKSTVSSRRKSSIDNEDVSQSVSDTIKRYLRMARKKSVHDGDANRFKSVNYDRNLRNIKAKGEINPPGMDEANNKAVQTLDAWAIVALDFIRGNESSINLQIAHHAWQKDLDERIRKKFEYDQICQNKEKLSCSNNSSKLSKYHSQSICISAPTSPTSQTSQTSPTSSIQIQLHQTNHNLREKTGRTASALLTSSSHFISNFWHANNTESSSFQNSKNGNVNETYISKYIDINSYICV